jgi:hypothetical protein
MVEVTGRRTGKTISFPAVIADYENGRYLVSMLGEDTSGVRNVRAAGYVPCCGTAAGNRSRCTKLTQGAALRSCAATSSAHQVPGRTSRSTTGLPSRSSSQSRHSTRCSG